MGEWLFFPAVACFPEKHIFSVFYDIHFDNKMIDIAAFQNGSELNIFFGYRVNKGSKQLEIRFIRRISVEDYWSGYLLK